MAKKIQLQPRERRVIIIGVVCLAAIAVFQFGRAPWAAYRKSFDDVANARNQLDQARLWFQAVSGAQAEQGALVELLNARQGYTSLQAYVDAAVRQHDLVRRSAYESRPVPGNPALEGVSISLKGVSMEELVSFVHALYANNSLLVLDTMNKLGPNPTNQGLDCDFVVLSPRQPSRS